LASTVLDFTGLAQKNGAVVSQVRIASHGTPIHAVRIGAGEIDLLLGTDSVVAVSPDALAKFAKGRGAIVLNGDETPTAAVVTDRDATLPTERMIDTLLGRAGDNGHLLSATRIAEGLFGNSMAANTLLVGYAWQKGLLPLSVEAFEAAIEANGAAVVLNKRAFAWGRLTATDPAAVDRIAGITPGTDGMEERIDTMIARRVLDLTAYQNRDYAARFIALIDHVRRTTANLGAGGEVMLRAVVTNAYKVMAYKDEYEVARLYTDIAFRDALNAQFAGSKRVSVYLAPPMISRIDPQTGRPAKRKFGPWIFTALTLLAKAKCLRSSRFDPFGHTAERRAERQLRDEYLRTIRTLCDELDSDSLRHAIAIAALPDMVRGYGPVKAAAMADYQHQRSALLALVNASAVRVAA
jgi:indolepyruvate ferredoxin oxidoreductase